MPGGGVMLIHVDKGKVDCTGAAALTAEWLGRAPNEGAGSGAVLELEGWYCIGATATQAPHVGSCERTDRTAAFSISIGR
jgi:hypothetical protein